MGKFLNGVKNLFKSGGRAISKFLYLEEWKRNKEKWPTAAQWLSFFSVIKREEKIIFLSLLTLIVVASIVLSVLLHLENTKIIPAEGGSITEVIIGQPQSLNPLFSPLNDADRDLSELLFCGLLKYNNKGELVNDLAKEYKITDNGTAFEFTLKENLFWQDGEKITSDDIIFTLESIQNPEVQSPLRLVWQGVRIEKEGEFKVKFILPNPYPPFIENFTFKILPRHIFLEIEPQQFLLKPAEEIIGSGPFKIKEIVRDKEDRIKKIILERNDRYYGKKPYLFNIEFLFVEDENEALSLLDKVTSLAGISPKNKEKIDESFKIYSLSLPRYFALFFNQEKAKALAQLKLREAMALSLNKKEIIDKALFSEGRIVESPLLPENNIEGEFKKYDFNLDEAKKRLSEIEDNITLEFDLFIVDQEEIKKAAMVIKENWEKIGIKLNVKALDPKKLLQEHIQERDYDILLFGQGLSMMPDPFSFWHSSQKKYPGLNLSLYQNDEVDEVLKKARSESDPEKRKELLQLFQKKLTEDLPAIFLYSPNYIYPIKKEVKGIKSKYILDPSKRFIGIEEWYIKEKRVSKVGGHDGIGRRP